jgi:cephalosporin hydroxylase
MPRTETRGNLVLHFAAAAGASWPSALPEVAPSAVDPRRRQLLELIPKGTVGAELGVFCGHFSESILQAAQPRRLHLIDPWWVAFGDWYPDWGAYTEFGRLTTRRAFELTYARVRNAIGAAEVHIHADFSTVWLKTLEDGYLDWAYLDSSHGYDETVAELQLLKSKVKPSGLILGDDFQVDEHHEHHGVFLAIQEFVKSEPYDLIYADSNMQWALRKEKRLVSAQGVKSMGARTEMSQAVTSLPAELIRNCRVLPDRVDILRYLPKGKVFAEVGVALGDFSAQVFEICAPKRFIAIDIFTMHHWPDTWDGHVGRQLNGMDHRSFYEKRFSSEAESGRLTILEGNSADKLEELCDKSVDVFYLDEDHSYAAVKADLAVIRRKIAPGGTIVMNDYTLFDQKTMRPYGVIQAANEFMIECGWEMIFFAFHPEMFCDIAIRELRQS